jgi:hypothetical protein
VITVKCILQVYLPMLGSFWKVRRSKIEGRKIRVGRHQNL